MFTNPARIKCASSKRPMLRVVNRLPRWFRNTALSFSCLGRRSGTQHLTQWKANWPMGHSRSRRPLPRTRTRSWSKSRSSRFNPTSSLTRNPPPYSVSSIARSRTPGGSSVGTPSSRRITSSTRSSRGNLRGCLGLRRPADGSADTDPSLRRYRKKERRLARRRATVLGA